MKKIINDTESKERIISAATKLFAKNGFEGTSIRRISKEASVNIAMISYYWGGKYELYQGIIDDLIEKQTAYAKQFIDFELNFNNLKKQEQVELLFNMIDGFVDFFYSKISKDLLVLLFQKQQAESFVLKSPAINYFRNLISAIFNKKQDDEAVILKTLFIISLVNSPRLLPVFSLNLMNKQDFSKENIELIRNNVKLYINALLKNEGIIL